MMIERSTLAIPALGKQRRFILLFKIKDLKSMEGIKLIR